MRRASGLTKTRPPLTWAGADRSAGAAGGCAGGAGAGSVFGVTPVGGAADAAARCPLPDGALAVNFSSAAGSSPSSSSSAIGSCTLMPCAPSGTMILPMRPSSAASYSIVALSVSISAMTSPACTSSPSFFSQRARLPSVIVGDRAGIRISIGMCCPFGVRARPSRLAVRHLARRGDNVLDLRHREAFEISGIGQWHVLAGDALQRRVEPIEAFLHDDCRDLGADPCKWPALLDRDDAVGLFDRLGDSRDIERP